MITSLKMKIVHWVKYFITSYVFLFKSDPSHFQVAENGEIKNKIYKFRYKIYHDELSRSVVGENTELKIIKDHFDEDPNTQLFYLENHNQIIATSRAIIWSKTKIPQEVMGTYSLEQYSWINNYVICEISRLMVEKNYRNQLVVLEFLCSTVRMMAEKYHMSFIVMSCKPHLVSRYLFLGFIPYTKHCIHYPDGIEIPLILLCDKKFLTKTKSPTRFLFSNSPTIDKNDIQSFLQFSDSPIITNPEKIMSIIINLKKTKNRFFSLPDNSIFYLLSYYGCYILRIGNEIELIHQKMMDKTMFLLVEGKIKIDIEHLSSIEFEEGCLVGEFAYFLSGHKRTANVGCQNATFFILKESAINMLAKKHKKLYIKFLEFVIENLIYKARIFNLK